MPPAARLLVLAAVALAGAARAQPATLTPETEAQPAEPAARRPAPSIMQPGEAIDFQSDVMTYDNARDVVTARGNVIVQRGGTRLRADTIVYDRKTGAIDAQGTVIVVDENGNRLFGDNAKVSEDLKSAAVENILIVLENGGRAVARSATRKDGVDTLTRAVYSPCAVTDGCVAIKPLWEIRAVRVVHDAGRGRFYYRGASFNVLGLPIVYLPRFSHPDGADRNAGGLLTPDARYDRILGLTAIAPYYMPLRPNADLTITPYIFSEAAPMLGLEYRQLLSGGPVRAGGLVTYSRQFTADPATGTIRGGNDQLRGYVYANGTYALSSSWRLTGVLRAASDPSFLRRYDITQDDVLRNLARAERFGDESYFSAEGWAFQGLRPFDRGGQTPIALPLLDWRWRPSARVLGGNIDLLANTLAVTRPAGGATQRALAQARYATTFTTAFGQRVALTAQVRADAYHAQDSDELAQRQYAGEDGWHGRVIPAAAIDATWPFAGPALGGVQTITPRVQIVASPFVTNGTIPNEDSRAIDLTENNLFDINRFPGYDRWEGGGRVSYGLTYTLDRPGWRVLTEVGQSYRLSRAIDIFPPGTGLTNQFSDIIGRATVQVGRYVSFTNRFRLNETTFAIRRNEADISVGTSRTFVQLAYTRLNRNIGIEDLRDREEVRAAGRLQFARYWAAFGAAIIDLTGPRDDPLATSGGFQPIRHRFGIAYDDECFSFSFTWRRDYTAIIDRPAGNSFLLRVAFKTLGR